MNCQYLNVAQPNANATALYGQIFLLSNIFGWKYTNMGRQSNEPTDISQEIVVWNTISLYFFFLDRS